jgi:hypothetical protein
MFRAHVAKAQPRPADWYLPLGLVIVAFTEVIYIAVLLKIFHRPIPHVAACLEPFIIAILYLNYVLSSRRLTRVLSSAATSEAITNSVLYELQSSMRWAVIAVLFTVCLMPFFISH